LEANQNLIEKVCGIRPPNVEIVDVGNDPNYVFLKDPSFKPINLFDADGNTVIVNSWVECAHYVKGDWSSAFQEIFPGDKYLVLISASAIFLYYFRNLYASYRKNNEIDYE
tara:strand:+ start:41 stop:373 length:333 start_codon:yes stop_codon:yes gene_type:complete